jgi:hypothetical protein
MESENSFFINVNERSCVVIMDGLGLGQASVIMIIITINYYNCILELRFSVIVVNLGIKHTEMALKRK